MASRLQRVKAKEAKARKKKGAYLQRGAASQTKATGKDRGSSSYTPSKPTSSGKIGLSTGQKAKIVKRTRAQSSKTRSTIKGAKPMREMQRNTYMSKSGVRKMTKTGIRKTRRSK